MVMCLLALSAWRAEDAPQRVRHPAVAPAANDLGGALAPAGLAQQLFLPQHREQAEVGCSSAHANDLLAQFTRRDRSFGQ